MNRALAVRGIQVPSFIYDFSIPEGPHHLSDTSDEWCALMLTNGADITLSGGASTTHNVKENAKESTSPVTTVLVTSPSSPISPSTLRRHQGRQLTTSLELLLIMVSLVLSNDTSKPSLQELALSLQVLLTKDGIASEGLTEGISRAEIKKREIENIHQSTLGALKRACELHANMVEDNRKLLKQNKRLQEHLSLAGKDVEELHWKISGEQTDKSVLEVALKSMDKEHKVIMTNLVKIHKEALEKYKMDTMQSFQDYLPDLKFKFLLHAQVVDGPFDACRVNFDTMSKLTGAQLDFDVQFPSRAAWETFVEKWKNNLLRP
ncbi:hypothetical protein J1N35_000217 [Gossypium stocksii]|uniref:Uncharacterized protein n=1 Tax=Gossypium stocksii TaxID=47602 RepID=A0A9D4AKN2_9ROSI|nr:hypothetical protein J1N35_000217 [Gossypium stocksii]